MFKCVYVQCLCRRDTHILQNMYRGQRAGLRNWLPLSVLLQWVSLMSVAVSVPFQLPADSPLFLHLTLRELGLYIVLQHLTGLCGI